MIQVAGKPAILVEDIKVKTEVVIDGKKFVAKQRIGGWKVMPPEHWAAVERKLQAVAEYETKNNIKIESKEGVKIEIIKEVK